MMPIYISVFMMRNRLTVLLSLESASNSGCSSSSSDSAMQNVMTLSGGSCCIRIGV